MKILISSDKFKSSLGASEVCEAIKSGLVKSNSDFECILKPLADGGDGTTIILKKALGLKESKLESIDPLGRKIQSKYYADSTTAYIELAEASGMWRLKRDELDVLKTTTIGTGLLMKHAISAGYRNIVLCLGGSCTNDVGLGIAHAMGFVFKDSDNNVIIPRGGNLFSITKIQAPEIDLDVSIRILCDVTNPLYGQNGAAHVFARQKGASDEQIEFLDEGMKHVAKLIKAYSSRDISSIAGGGAAGGIAAGLYGLLDNVVLENGFDYLSSVLNLPAAIANADLVVTGEGRLDGQSLGGKVIGKVAELCRQAEVPLAVIAGDCTLSEVQLKEAKVSYCSTIVSQAESEEDAIANAEQHISRLAKALGEWWLNRMNRLFY